MTFTFDMVLGRLLFYNMEAQQRNVAIAPVIVGKKTRKQIRRTFNLKSNLGTMKRKEFFLKIRRCRFYGKQ